MTKFVIEDFFINTFSQNLHCKVDLITKNPDNTKEKIKDKEDKK